MTKDSKILLILDIDETLIHARKDALERNADFMVFHYHIYKRPFLDEFLQAIQPHFQVAFWSSASDDYVEQLINIIYPEQNPREFVWGRSRCTPRSEMVFNDEGRIINDSYGHYNYIKRLKKVKDKGYSLDKVLIVDDTPHKVNNSYGNAIYMKEFNGESNDFELKKLLEYLLTLKDLSDVRRIEKRGWSRREG